MDLEICLASNIKVTSGSPFEKRPLFDPLGLLAKYRNLTEFGTRMQELQVTSSHGILPVTNFVTISYML